MVRNQLLIYSWKCFIAITSLLSQVLLMVIRYSSVLNYYQYIITEVGHLKLGSVIAMVFALHRKILIPFFKKNRVIHLTYVPSCDKLGFQAKTASNVSMLSARSQPWKQQQPFLFARGICLNAKRGTLLCALGTSSLFRCPLAVNMILKRRDIFNLSILNNNII